MSSAQTPLQERLMAALVEDGCLSFHKFSEAELVDAGDEWVTSPLFGDCVELLLSEWRDLDAQVAVVRIISIGFKRNQFRDALIHAINVIAESDIEDLKSYANALHALASNEDSPFYLRVEAVAGLTRFALRAPKYSSFAFSGVLLLIDAEGTNALFKAKLCRIISVLHEQLSWNEAADSLVTLSANEACAAEAKQELGFLEMLNGFRCEDIASMSACFSKSAFWFHESSQFAEDSPRARMYRLISSTLVQALTSKNEQAAEVKSLNIEAWQWAVYNPPRAGATWLHPPPEAELEWVQLISKFQSTPDIWSLLAGAVQLFEKVRAIRIPIKDSVEYRVPQGFSNTVQQGRLLGMLRDCLHRGISSVTLSNVGRTQLENNLAQIDLSPGKN